MGKVPFGSREKYLLVLGRNEVTLLLCGYENHHTHGKATKSLLQCGLDYADKINISIVTSPDKSRQIAELFYKVAKYTGFKVLKL